MDNRNITSDSLPGHGQKKSLLRDGSRQNVGPAAMSNRFFGVSTHPNRLLCAIVTLDFPK
jgi:hypothetical protein